MSPPHVGASRRVRKNTRSSAWVIEIEMREIPIVVDVDDIHTPEYDPTTMHVEEEKNPTQKAEKWRRTSKGQNPTCLRENGCNKKKNHVFDSIGSRVGPRARRKARNKFLVHTNNWGVIPVGEE
jgi:hypothetical protein